MTQQDELKLALSVLKNLVGSCSPDALSLAISAASRDMGLERDKAREYLAPLIKTHRDSPMTQMFWRSTDV